MKKLLSLLLAIVLLTALCSCKKKKETPLQTQPPQQTGNYWDNAPGARTVRVLGTTLNAASAPVRLVLRMNVSTGADDATPADVSVYMNGQDIASDFELSGFGRMGTLSSEGKSYVLWHDGTTVLTGSDAGLASSLGYLAQGHDESYYSGSALRYAAGNETINSTAYDYEELTDSGAVTRFYFDAGTDRLRYIRTGESLIEVVEYDNNVDTTVFGLPEGYDTLDYETFLSGLSGSQNRSNAYGFMG
ncbi:MAG: hypothetical protein VB092_07775 [Oscillospiraceae bacterium]|nr:hypothetical protein [Oscillospiraceae bacterium]